MDGIAHIKKIQKKKAKQGEHAVAAWLEKRRHWVCSLLTVSNALSLALTVQ